MNIRNANLSGASGADVVAVNVRVGNDCWTQTAQCGFGANGKTARCSTPVRSAWHPDAIAAKRAGVPGANFWLGPGHAGTLRCAYAGARGITSTTSSGNVLGSGVDGTSPTRRAPMR